MSDPRIKEEAAEVQATASTPSTASTASSRTLLGDLDDRVKEDRSSINMSKEGSSDGTNITAAERIRELNKVDMEIVKMLGAMGRAVEVMSEKDDIPMTLEARRQVFQDNVKEALARLATVDVLQRRSIAALAEAGIIESDDRISTKRPPASLLGNLDVSLLNSQNDKVGKEIEAEQWSQVRDVLEKLSAGL